MSKEKKGISKSDWVSNFNLVGKPVINDYTFKIDEHSEKSDWIYNALNLGVDCGEKYGTVYAEMMGGYGEGRKNTITKPSKDDSNKKVVVEWEERFDEDIMKEISDSMLITVGLEKASDGKTFYKKFLSEYDAIAYVKEHLTKDMVVNVRGNLKYNLHNDKVQVKKVITSIALSKVDDSSKYKATFTQSTLIDKDSASLKNIDKDKGVMYVNTRVLDFLKEYNGITLVNEKGEEKGGNFPFNKQFEFALDLTNEEKCKKAEKFLKVKKGITQITFEGDFIEGGASVTPTWEDVPQDIKDLVDAGFYTKEEALAKCTVNGNRERRMVLRAPVFKMVGDEDIKTPHVQKFEERYTEDDLFLDYLYEKKNTVENVVLEAPEEDEVDNSMDWLNKLM